MLLTPQVREKMGKQACAMAAAVGYYTTGTCEFLVDKNLDFYFLEMNTRLQVEHPVSEEITGVDLVEEMIKIAAGYPLDFTQSDIKIKGHAVESRVYAEDASRKFLPSIGFLKKYIEPKPREGLRIDTGVCEGSEISMYYDPMISKLITHANTREEAIRMQNECIDEYVIQGVVDNLGFCKSMLNNDLIKKGTYDTSFIGKTYPEGYHGEKLTHDDRFILSAFSAGIKNRLIRQTTEEGQHPQKWSVAYIVHDNENHFKVEVDHENHVYNVWHVQKPNDAPVKIQIKDFSIEKNTLIISNILVNGAA